MAKRSVKKKKRQPVEKAIAHVHSTFNNTIITITKENGDVMLRRTAGSVGYKGTRKSTPYAAQKAAEECIEELKTFNTKIINVYWSKTGPGRDSVIKAFQGSDMEVQFIKDATKRSHSISLKKLKRR